MRRTRDRGRNATGEVALTEWDGWKTRRVRHPVAILGERHGIQLGVELDAYRGLVDPYRDLAYVLHRVRDVAVPALERELTASERAPHESPTDTSDPRDV